MKPFQLAEQKTSSSPRESDSRSQTRVPARYYAYVHAPTGVVLSECLVKDLSEIGAHIILPKAARLPKKIILRVTGEKTPLSASVIWQSGTECGLKFNDAGFI